MEQILLAYGLPHKIVSVIMMLYKNMKATVHSPDGDTDFFKILAEVFQGDTLTSYFLILCLDCILWTSIELINENGFILKKSKSRQYPAKTMTDVDYTDNLALLTESWLHSLKQAAEGIGLYGNAYKTEFIYSEQKGAFST